MLSPTGPSRPARPRGAGTARDAGTGDTGKGGGVAGWPGVSQYGLAWGVTVIAANRDIRPFRLRAGVVEDESHARCRQIP